MRQRGGCDFIHVTNGDNIYHVDFFRHQLAVFNARPDVGSTAVDFYCHLNRNFKSVEFRIAKIDLGCMLVRPSVMRKASARRPDPRSWAALLPLLNYLGYLSRAKPDEGSDSRLSYGSVSRRS